MDDFNEELTIKTKVQHIQFEQWMRSFFQLTYKLHEGYNPTLQDLYYIKLYAVLTEGLEYARSVLNQLEGGENHNKTLWYTKCIAGLRILKSHLTEREFIYIEYRRHNICHIFQNQYEHIQEDFSIKKYRKGKTLTEVDFLLKSLLIEHGNDRNIDEYLSNKMKLTLTCLYEELTRISNQS